MQRTQCDFFVALHADNGLNDTKIVATIKLGKIYLESTDNVSKYCFSKIHLNPSTHRPHCTCYGAITFRMLFLTIEKLMGHIGNGVCTLIEI